MRTDLHEPRGVIRTMIQHRECVQGLYDDCFDFYLYNSACLMYKMIDIVPYSAIRKIIIGK